MNILQAYPRNILVKKNYIVYSLENNLLFLVYI